MFATSLHWAIWNLCWSGPEMSSEVIQKTVYGYVQDEANAICLVFNRDGQVVETNKYTAQLLIPFIGLKMKQIAY